MRTGRHGRRLLSYRSLTVLTALALLVLGNSILLPAGEGPQVECLSVSQSRITAEELADQDTRFAILPGETDLGYSPDPGKWREIEVPASHRESPVSKVCVMRRLSPLSPDKLQDALSKAFPAEEASLSWEIIAFPEGSYPDGTIEFRRSGIAPPPRGSNELLWRGTLIYEPGRTLPIWVKLRLKHDIECLRTTDRLRRGQSIEPSHVEAVPCDAMAIFAGALLRSKPTAGIEKSKRYVNRPPEGLLASNSGATDWMLATDLPAGAWVLQEHLTVVPTLRKGHHVRLVVRSGAVVLTVPAEAEQAGAVGEHIWVRQLRDRKRLRGRVTGPDEILVEPDAERPMLLSKPSSTIAPPLAARSTVLAPPAPAAD
jgi:flagella basal body P-ring formation protein FlgA